MTGRTRPAVPGLLACVPLVFLVALSCKDNSAPVGNADVKPTNNPLVASYTVQPKSPGKVSVEFGPTKAYGFTTSEQHTPEDGSPLSIYVAGMRANTTYHMRAVVKLDNGQTSADSDHIFKTTAFPSGILPGASVSKSGQPQSGIELVNATLSNVKGYLEAYATDLDGNMIWGYDYPDRDANSIIQPIKPLPNGHFGMIISYASQFVFTPDKRSTVNTLREIDLAGNTVRELKLDDLNQRLKEAGYTFTLLDYHHDFTYLDNGHWLVLANLVKPYNDLPGHPGTTQVIGDAVIDLDPNWRPVWVWNEFDHLDVNRHPMEFPDWTHTNAIVYIPGDGNLLISMRHQNWIVKVDYRNGEGDGTILWRLGQGGDFQLLNGTDPTDWFYAQHGPDLRPSGNAGTFLMSVMDNGDDRMFPSGETCGSPGEPPCMYTRVPVYEIDEKAMTATLKMQQTFPPDQYSFFGGVTTWMENGDLEYDLCAEPGYTGILREVTYAAQPQTVWQMTITKSNVYRANRMPSLYPGVAW